MSVRRLLRCCMVSSALMCPAGLATAQPKDAAPVNAGDWTERPFRLPDIDPGSYTPEQRALSEESARMFHVKDITGPFRVWIRNPTYFRAALSFIRASNASPALGVRLSRLASITVARLWTAQYHWFIQAPFAERDGLSADVVEAIRIGQQPNFTREDEQVVYDVTTELTDARALSDATFRHAREVLGDDALTELISGLSGATLVSMTIRAFNIDAPMPFPATPLPAAR